MSSSSQDVESKCEQPTNTEVGQRSSCN